MATSLSTPSEDRRSSGTVQPPSPEKMYYKHYVMTDYNSSKDRRSSSSSTEQLPSPERKELEVMEKMYNNHNEGRRSITELLPSPKKREKLIRCDSHAQSVMRSSRFQFLPPNSKLSELRVVLLGNSWSERSSVGNFILGETKFNTEEEPDCFLRERVQLKGKEVVLINTPDLLHPQTVRRSRQAELISGPGPHVFLLVLQPEDFTEEHKLKLCRFLQLFNDRSFDHSLVLISTPREERPGFMEKYLEHPPLKDMIKECQYRFLWQKNLELPELLTRLGQIVKENNGEHLSSH